MDWPKLSYHIDVPIAFYFLTGMFINDYECFAALQDWFFSATSDSLDILTFISRWTFHIMVWNEFLLVKASQWKWEELKKSL